MSDAPPKNSEALEGLLRAAAAAESLMRLGATEPALILYEELARAHAGPASDDGETSGGSVERLERARGALRTLLHEQLKTELLWARGLLGDIKSLIGVIAAVGVLAWALVLMRSPSEVSKGARWTASSALAGMATSSGELPRRRLFYSAPSYFFHTNADHEPWIAIDLGRERTVTSVRLTNRLDCCRERAREVVVELCSDATTFTASRPHPKEETDFRQWEARFPPTKARFVRIRGTHDQCLHLADVRVFGS